MRSLTKWCLVAGVMHAGVASASNGHEPPRLPEAGLGFWHDPAFWSDDRIPGVFGSTRSATLPSLGVPYGVTISDAPVLLSGLTIEPGVDLILADKIVLTGTGRTSINNHGRITADMPRADAAIYVERDATIAGPGTIDLRFGGIETAPGATLSQLAPHTIHLDNTFRGSFYNKSTITAGARAPAHFTDSSVVSTGEIRVEGTLALERSSIDATGGSIRIDPDATLILRGSSSLSGGAVRSSTGGAVLVAGSGIELNATTFSGQTSIRLAPHASALVGSRGISFNGILHADHDTTIDLAGTLRGTGEVRGQATLIGAPGRIANGLRLAGGTLAGRVSVSGTLSPGGSGFGAVLIEGEVKLQRDGTVLLDVAPGARDAITGSGALRIAPGAALRVRLDDSGPLPEPGSVLTLIDLGEIEGGFGSVEILPAEVADSLGLSIRQTDTRVELVVDFCRADANEDGRLDARDFAAWLSAFNAGDLSADANDDGRLTPADYGAWLGAFRRGCP